MTADLVAWLTQILDEDEEEAGKSKYRDDAWWMEGPFDADHVLADIAAKRAIIEMALTVEDEAARDFPPPINAMNGARASLAMAFVRRLASAYADRPGYQDEWRL